MADESKKSIEMRVSELEDKISRIHITEDEMKTYQKVSGLLGAGGGGGASPCIAAHSPCIAAQSPMHGCIVYDCYNCVSGCWTECWSPIRACIRQCCIFQPTVTFRPGGGGFGGGFGSLGG